MKAQIELSPRQVGEFMANDWMFWLTEMAKLELGEDV